MKVKALVDLHVEGQKTIKKDTVFETTKKAGDKTEVIITDENAKALIKAKKLEEIKGTQNVTK